MRHWEWACLKRLCHFDMLTLRGHTNTVTSVSFSPDGKRLASKGDSGSTVKIWDALSGQELLTLRETAGYVSNVAFNPDGKRLVAGCGDGTVKIWAAAAWEEPSSPKPGDTH
jgi:WD40 repeat protein